MQIEFDPANRERALVERGLDFARAGEVFAGRHFTAEDLREDCSEPPRGEARRIISMRKANEWEQAIYARRVG